jgi:hypothetical protein
VLNSFLFTDFQPSIFQIKLDAGSDAFRRPNPAKKILRAQCALQAL